MLPDDGHSFCTIEELERLTVQAFLAAENGDWDTVDSCITKRELLFGQVAILPSLAVHLRALDARIEASLLIAHKAAAAALAETGRIRNNIERLQQRTDTYQTTQSAIVSINA